MKKGTGVKIIKSDWTIVREAEDVGLMVAMTSVVQRGRAELNDELSTYFRENLSGYNGSYDEDEGEDILYSINEYLREKGIDRYPLDYPQSSGTNIHLIPVNDNIQLKLLVVDEYYGSGDYSKYVMANYFKITENATKEDVDGLIAFVNEVLQ